MAEIMQSDTMFEWDKELKQLLADILQAHIELEQMGQEWIDKAHRIGLMVQLVFQRTQTYYKTLHRLFGTLGMLIPIPERTLYWYVQIVEGWPQIEAARFAGAVINAKAVRLLLAKPKMPEQPVCIDDGWEEKQAQHFYKGGITLKPDGGAWGVFAKNEFFCSTRTLQEAKEVGESLLSKNANEQAQQPTQTEKATAAAAAEKHDDEQQALDMIEPATANWEPQGTVIENADESDPNEEEVIEKSPQTSWKQDGRTIVKDDYRLEKTDSKEQPWKLSYKGAFISSHESVFEGRANAMAHKARERPPELIQDEQADDKALALAVPAQTMLLKDVVSMRFEGEDSLAIVEKGGGTASIRVDGNLVQMVRAADTEYRERPLTDKGLTHHHSLAKEFQFDDYGNLTFNSLGAKVIVYTGSYETRPENITAKDEIIRILKSGKK